MVAYSVRLVAGRRSQITPVRLSRRRDRLELLGSSCNRLADTRASLLQSSRDRLAKLNRQVELLEKAAVFLSQCEDLGEVKELWNQAKALELYSKQEDVGGTWSIGMQVR
jgi:hypothetical protein